MSPARTGFAALVLAFSACEQPSAVDVETSVARTIIIKVTQINTTTGGVNDWATPQENFFGPDNPRNRFFGQLFTVPTGTPVLQSFSFWALVNPGYGTSAYRAHIAAWDDVTNTYHDVWASTDRSITSPLFIDVPAPTPLSFYGEQAFTPGLALSPGVTYLAYTQSFAFLSFLNARGDPATNFGYMWAARTGEEGGGGGGVDEIGSWSWGVGRVKQPNLEARQINPPGVGRVRPLYQP